MAREGGSMKPNTGRPPRWAEFLLERLLAARQSVTGDLREQYAEAIVPRIGRATALCPRARPQRACLSLRRFCVLTSAALISEGVLMLFSFGRMGPSRHSAVPGACGSP